MSGTRPKRLLASIHDVGPGSADAVARLAELLENRLGEGRFAMLVVPNYWGRHPLAVGTPFATELRRYADRGVEMFVHGWYHRDPAEHHGANALKARYLTAGEGEFLGLSKAEAVSRMKDGRALIEDIIGRPVTGFVAPAWLYGEGARAALAESDFEIAEDHMRVWSPRTGRVLARGPVVTWASRTAMRTASSLAFAALARMALHSLTTLRLAVHPGDLSKTALVSSIDATLATFSSWRPAGRYEDLLDR